MIDPKKLDRLDYLIWRLKEHGVYTNLNLHVSRWFDQAEGFSGRQQRPDYDKGLDNFEPRMIEFQKKYARDLLTHVNPYTKTPYTREPAIAFIEINNENALWAVWGWGQLDGLPEPYAGTFRKLWNGWLTKKYGTTEKLRDAWNADTIPLGGEMLRNVDLGRPPADAWYLEKDPQTAAEWSVKSDPAAGRYLEIVVTRQGEVAWHPQLSQSGFAVKKGGAYTLTFRARADGKRQIAVNCMMAHEPWERLGLDTHVDVGPQWKDYRLVLIADRDDANARITVSNLPPGTYALAGVSLRSGGIIGVEPGQRLERGHNPGAAAAGDAVHPHRPQRFLRLSLRGPEATYWSGMYRFLQGRPEGPVARGRHADRL